MTVKGKNKFCNYISISHFNIAGLAAVGPLCWVLGWAGAGKLTNYMQIGMQGTTSPHCTLGHNPGHFSKIFKIYLGTSASFWKSSLFNHLSPLKLLSSNFWVIPTTFQKWCENLVHGFPLCTASSQPLVCSNMQQYAACTLGKLWG